MIVRTCSIVCALSALLSQPSAQSNWLNVSPQTGPSDRESPAMAYDAGRGVVVLFGGMRGSSRLSDTWEWDGYLWTQKTPKTRPPARSWSSMVYDAKRKQVVLYGGYNGQSALGDTWAWNGTVWTQLSPTNSPGRRNGHAMSYDSDRSVIVLFGGSTSTSSNNTLNDTWEWNGTTWVNRNIPTTSSPEKRMWHSMAYDAKRKLTLLHGGYNRGPTWQWNGTKWTNAKHVGTVGRGVGVG